MRQDDSTTIMTFLLTLFVLMAFTIILLFRIEAVNNKLEVADIAGIGVPPVSCQEDEAIWWVDVDQLGCVHFEEVR